MTHQKRRLEKSIAAVLATLLGANCASMGKRPPADQAAAAPSSPAYLEATRVLVGDCVFRPHGELALLAPILATLISKAFNRVGQTLEQAGKPHTWQTTAFTNFELSDADRPRCIHVVRGRFALDALGENGWAAGTPYAQKSVLLARRGIRLTAKPDFFFEGAFRLSADRAALAIVPTVVAFEKPIGDRPLRSDDERHLKLSFAFHPPGKAASAADVPATELVLGQLRASSFKEFDARCLRAPSGDGAPAAGPPPGQPGGAPGQPGGPPPEASPSPATAAGGPARAACWPESLWFTLPSPRQMAPLTATVVVSETQGASNFLAFVGEVFKETRDELEAAAKVALIDSEREKARLESLKASHDLAVAYDTAATAAVAALEGCAKEGTAAKSGEARIKQQTANLAATKAGRTPPCAQLVGLTGTPDSLKSACTAALSACAF